MFDLLTLDQKGALEAPLKVLQANKVDIAPSVSKIVSASTYGRGKTFRARISYVDVRGTLHSAHFDTVTAYDKWVSHQQRKYREYMNGTARR